MSGTPINIREVFSCSRRTDQMRQKHIIENMSDEEKRAAQVSLSEAYTEPYEFYQNLRRRATKNPLFLQRSLKYQIEAKHQRRIQMTMSLSGGIDAASLQNQKLFPLYIMLARLVSSKPTPEYTEVYKFSRVCLLTGFGGDSQGKANFLLPRMDKLELEAKAGSVAILFINFANAQHSQFGIDSSKIHSGTRGAHLLWSKIPLESLYSSWKKYPDMDMGQKVDSASLVEMQPCFLQLKTLSERSVVIQVPSNPLTSSSPLQVQVTISAQEVGGTENSPYSSSFSFDDMPSSPVELPIFWLRKGQVAFNFLFFNNKNIYPTQVTEDFTCPICLVKCASFKGLHCHMPSNHDLFNFEFWVSENYPAVNVSPKTKSKTMINESIEDGIKARKEPYFYSSKKSRRRKQKTLVRNSRHGPHKTNDAGSVKSVKSQVIPHGGAESSSQVVTRGKSPADLQMMNMWNSFARQHQVFADGRVSWGCEAFSKLHGPLIARDQHLLWCWKKYMWTLKYQGRLDARTLNNCTVFLEQLRK